MDNYSEEIIAKLPIVEKGYSLDLSRIDEGYLYQPYSTSATTRSKAKSNILSDLHSNYDYPMRLTGDEVTFLNIPIERNKLSDIVIFEGKQASRHEVAELLHERKLHAELDLILADDNITHCYIIKGGRYYCSNYNGYTDYMLFAGVYTKQDAIHEGKRCHGSLKIVPIIADEHNTYLQNHIDKIKSRLILP